MRPLRHASSVPGVADVFFGANGAVPLHRFTGSSIKVLKWLVEAGEPIQRGQAVLEMETDKATAEIEATASGWLLEQKSGNS